METREFARVGEQMLAETLPNGLPVYVVPKRGFNKKYAFFATSYGGADRRFLFGGQWLDTPAGIAHFLEHKLFDTKDGNALTDLAMNGASPNAFTSFEMTAYHFSCTEKFEENLKILLEFVSVPYFTPESVEKERGIIGQEIRMIEDTPQHAVYYNFLKALYENHPVRDTIAGTVESIGEITAQTLYDCHKAFYTPANMVLCVAGDVDAPAVCEIAQALLPAEAGAPPMKEQLPYSDKPKQEKREVRMEVSTPLFMAGAKAQPGGGLRQELAGNLALDYLAGKSSPLYTRLYNDGLITGDFSAGFESGRSFSISAFSGESRDPERVMAEIRAELRRVLAGSPDSERMERAKKAALGRIFRELDQFESICYDQADAHFRGEEALRKAEVMDTLTADDALTFLHSSVDPEKLVLSAVRPR